MTVQEVDRLAQEYVRAIAWNVEYYFNGVPNWEWFYPFHYSPYASDLGRIERFTLDVNEKDKTFIGFKSKGIPFKPFEQLLAVLPYRSRELLPEPLQALFFNSSVIADFYPRDFELDLNDKQNDWEAIVKIPFVDERRLINAMGDLMLEIHKVDLYRNERAPTVVFRRGERIAEYTYGKLLVKPEHIRRGVLVDKSEWHLHRKGYPQLSLIPFKSSLERCGVKVFNFPSKELSWIIKIGSGIADVYREDEYMENEIKQKNLYAAKKLINKNVLVNWPYVKEAKVISVYERNEHGIFQHFESQTFRKNDPQLFVEVERKVSDMSGTLGICLEKFDIAFEVKVAAGYKCGYKSVLGTDYVVFEQEFRPKTELFPFGTVPLEESRFLLNSTDEKRLSGASDQYLITLEEWFRPGKLAFHMSLPFYGAVCSIVGPVLASMIIFRRAIWIFWERVVRLDRLRLDYCMRRL